MIVPHALAAIQNPVVPGGTSPETGANTMALLIAVLWKTLVILGGLAFLIFFLWGGLEWIMAGGDKQKIETARNKLTQGLIGLIILAGSLVIVKFVGQAVGLNPLYIVWPTPNSPASDQQTGSQAPPFHQPKNPKSN